jgi:hypothetical protein
MLKAGFLYFHKKNIDVQKNLECAPLIASTINRYSVVLGNLKYKRLLSLLVSLLPLLAPLFEE